MWYGEIWGVQSVFSGTRPGAGTEPPSHTSHLMFVPKPNQIPPKLPLHDLRMVYISFTLDHTNFGLIWGDACPAVPGPPQCWTKKAMSPNPTQLNYADGYKVIFRCFVQNGSNGDFSGFFWGTPTMHS